MTRRADRRQSERSSAYKLCSLALQYPDDELLAGRAELAAAAAELPAGPVADALGLFFAWFAQAPSLELAQHYVKTFDLHKRTGLYVTFYSHGDRRERGLVLLRAEEALPRRRAATGRARAARLPAADARVRRSRRPRAR